jgi:hypothetical protein
MVSLRHDDGLISWIPHRNIRSASIGRKPFSELPLNFLSKPIEIQRRRIIRATPPRAVKRHATRPTNYAGIQWFEGLPSLHALALLDFGACPVSNFEGEQPQLSLSRFNRKNTPLFASGGLPLISLLAVGASPTHVNKVAIDRTTRDIAAAISDQIRPFLAFDAWVIVELDPLHLGHTTTGTRRRFFIERARVLWAAAGP